MDKAAQVLYWVKLGGLALAVLVAVIGTTVQLRKTRFSRGRHAVFAALPLVALGGFLVLLAPRVGWVWLVVAVVLGAAAGWFLGRGRTATVDGEGRTRMRRSPVAPLVLGVAYLLVAWLVLFGTTYLLAWAILLFALASGLSAGSAAGEIAAAGSVATAGAATPASATGGEAPQA